MTLLGAPSADGRYLSLVEGRDLAVRELATGRSMRLTRAQGGEFAYFSAISRDSRSVAYAWFNADGFYELRVVPLGGGESRILFRNPEAGFVQPCAWTPDNRFILTLLFRKDNVSQIALIPAAGGEARVLRSLNWVYPKRMDISPDGKLVIYDSFAPGSTVDRTIYSLALDGTAGKQLVMEPGSHLFPLFAPDGKSFYYLSGEDLVRQDFDGGKRILARNLGRALPLGVTGRGELYYGVRTGASDVFLADVREVAKTARRVSLRFPNRNLAPAFSPDGKRLAYLSRRGAENFGQEARAVVVRDLEGEGEEEMPVRMAHIERVGWRPDGAALLLSGSDGKGRGGLFEFDLAAKRTRPLQAEIGGPGKGFSFYSLGKEVVYVDGPVLRDLRGEPRGVATALPRMLAAFPVDGHGVSEWLPCAAGLFGIRGQELVRFQPEGQVQYTLPGNRQPGAAMSPDGRTIALTAGRERQEIWVLEVGAPDAH